MPVNPSVLACTAPASWPSLLAVIAYSVTAAVLLDPLPASATSGDLWNKWSITAPPSGYQDGYWGPVINTPHLEGQTSNFPLFAVHSALLYDGEAPRLLLFRNHALVYNFDTEDTSTVKLRNPAPSNDHNLFCAGYTIADELLVIVGGSFNDWNSDTVANAPLTPVTVGYTSFFDPASPIGFSSFVPSTDMPAESGDVNATCPEEDPNTARYYPTCTTLPDGRVLVTAGDFWTDCNEDGGWGEPPDDLDDGNEITLQERWAIFDPVEESWEVDDGASGGTFTIPWTPITAEYPRMISYPNVKALPYGLFWDGNDSAYQTPDSTHLPSYLWWPLDAWDGGSANEHDDFKRENRSGAACVVLTVDARRDSLAVLMVGGGRYGIPVAGDEGAEIIVYSDTGTGIASSGWEATAAMSSDTGRWNTNAVLLPDGSVFVVGGEVRNASNVVTAQNHDCEIFTPNGGLTDGTWEEVAGLTVNRGHHSVALLLPDGRVFSAGHETGAGTAEKNYHIYYPPYLFTSAPGWAARDTIETAPATVNYGLPFEITLLDDDAADIEEVVLMRPSAPTHATDFTQGRIRLSHAVVPGDAARLIVSGPKDETYGPEGYYMLFVLDDGVPSEAAWVHVERGSYTVASGQSRRWGADVWLDQDFEVEAGGELEILPGTTVHAEADTLVGILIKGALDAQGTEQDPIVFTSKERVTATAGLWKGLAFELAGNVSSGYGFVGALEPISRISHARIENADVGIRIKDLVAPALSNVTFQNCQTGGGAVTRDILLDQSDVVLPWGVWNTAMNSDVEEDRVVWDLEAPVNVVATNTVTPGKNHPTATLGDTTKVDLFVDGGLLTRNDAGQAAFVWFRPFTAVDSLGTGWGGIEVHSYAKGTTLGYARVSHAEDPLFFAYPESCKVVNSQVHHYANYGIRVLGGANDALTVESTLIARGPGLGATRGVWGIYAEEVPSLRVLNSKIYDYSHGASDGWTQSGVNGGGIRVANGSQFCGTTLANADSVVFRGNALVGPGENYTSFKRSALQLDWACGASNRDVVVEGNGIVRWFHGLKVDESRDTDVRCNRVKDNLFALEFYRDTQPTSDPPVRFKENQFVGSFERTIYVDEGMEHAALGSPSSTSDRGLNRFVLDDPDQFYVHQHDSTYTSEVLHAEQNQWHDGNAETSETDIRNQSQPVGSPVLDRIEADSPITSSYTISCLPGVPDTLAPALGVLSEEVRTLAGSRQESAPDGERDPGAALAAVPGADLPAVTELLGVRPNPARIETTLRFAVGREEIHPIRMAVFDVRGRRVATLLDGVAAPGVHEVSWNGVDASGQQVAAGVYFLRFEAGAVHETRKIVHLR